MNPNDLGVFQTVEGTGKVKISDFMRQVNTELKKFLLAAKLDLAGVNVGIQTSKTGFNGKRLWFSCPLCSRRVGTVFSRGSTVGCRKCLGLKYKKSRFKGMVELS